MQALNCETFNDFNVKSITWRMAQKLILLLIELMLTENLFKECLSIIFISLFNIFFLMLFLLLSESKYAVL